MQDLTPTVPKTEIENKTKTFNEVKDREFTRSSANCNKGAIDENSISASNESVSNNLELETSVSKELNLIDDIKNTMEHFEKFSDHIREIPRLKSCPVATSTPFSDKQNSKSESNLLYPERRPRRYSHVYNFNTRKEYSKSKTRQCHSDLFLRPLPGGNLYSGGINKRCDYDPVRIYGSVDSLTNPTDYKDPTVWKSMHNDDKFDFENAPAEGPLSILKKSESDCGDKSTSSADSVKDIRIYQNGGILIMQNFKDNFDTVEKKEISNFSAKLIENCNKLKEEIDSFTNIKEKSLGGNSSEESKSSGKMVQFDLFESDYQKKGDFSAREVTSSDGAKSKGKTFEIYVLYSNF